ncbi:MAG TPA: hypothetical protein VD948_08870 [Rhodothermales bacterium]|nr:hypothetical protein [Rhodothermales bacterium]
MKKEFLIERQGKQFVLYAGLLDMAHEKGLQGIETEIVQLPTPENGHTAVVTARVTTATGVFTGIGDADQSNVSRMMLPHLLRMAETRAKARALRDAVNVGVAALEELGPNGAGGDEDDDGPAPARAPQRRLQAVPRDEDDGFGPPPEIQQDPRRMQERPSGNGPEWGNPPPTENQIRALHALSRKVGKPIPSGLDRAGASDLITVWDRHVKGGN